MEALVLQHPRQSDHPAQQPDTGNGGFRGTGTVTGADEGMWSGKAKREEEGEVAKKTQLEDLAISPCSSETLDSPTSSLFLRSSRGRECGEETGTLESTELPQGTTGQGKFLSFPASER